MFLTYVTILMSMLVNISRTANLACRFFESNIQIFQFKLIANFMKANKMAPYLRLVYCDHDVLGKQQCDTFTECFVIQE